MLHLCAAEPFVLLHEVHRAARARQCDSNALGAQACAESSRSRLSHMAGCGRFGRRSAPLATGGTAVATASGARSPSNGLAARCRASTLACPVLSPARAWLLATPLISPLTPLRVRLVGAEGREVDDHHHHHRAQGGGRLLGGLPLRFRRSSAPRAHRRAAAGRCEAAWSCKAAAEAAVAVQQRGSCHRAARARRLRVSDGFGGAVLVAFRGQHARRCMRKKLPCSSAFFSRYVHVCACALRVFDSLNCPVHEGMHGVAGPWRFVPS